MEQEFEKEKLSCLDTLVCQTQNSELTQELKLSEGLPDVGRILTCWGQEILRTKEWRLDEVVVTGGVMVWVLYLPEEGGAPQTVNTWLPFQMKWELPEGAPEGMIRVCARIRSADARTVSPRKILVRCGVGLRTEAAVPAGAETIRTGDAPEGVELLREKVSLSLQKELGERTFFLEEELTPGGAEKLLYYSLSPEILEQKVMGNKIAFRGNGNLHVLCLCEDGQAAAEDFSLPFSQFADLSETYGTQAQADLIPAVTDLELELDEEGKLRLKAEVLGQYRITEPTELEIVTDGYAPGRKLELERSTLELPRILDSQEKRIAAEQSTAAQSGSLVDSRVLADFPRQRKTEAGVALIFPGSFQTLCYGDDGTLLAAGGRFEAEQMVPAGEAVTVTAWIGKPAEPQIGFENGTMTFRTELPVGIRQETREPIPVITGLTLGENRERDANRPSLILRRNSGVRLWDLAKEAGSTVEAIRKANALEGDPTPGQMLIIPVL